MTASAQAGSADGVRFKVGADIGGTFTDVVMVGSDGSVAAKKMLSTPESYGRAIVAAIRELVGERGATPAALSDLVHASTIATNAILELKGAATGLITTKGFRDVLEMRRLRIPVLYDLQYQKPPPLVPRRLRLEVDERMGPHGAVWSELDEASVISAVAALKDAGVQAVAIALLHAYADPTHEQRVAEIVRAHLPPDVFVTCSSDILPEIREYERTSTAVVNAYVGPVVRDYLGALARDMRGIGAHGALHIMQSNGGVMTVEAAQERPAYIVESGPAAGVIACARMARALGLANVISFDMGGTTAKAAMIEDGEPARTSEYEVGSGINLSSKLVKGGGYPIKLPFIDVSEIGAGGGSIVSLDATGGIRVGPRSAGAMPGPVCYGLGGEEPTFTDAMVATGYLNPNAIAGGRVKLDADAALALLEARIARPLGLPLAEAAHGIYTIAASTMTRAVKAVTTYRGRDPRDFALVAFGGNGPIVAAEIARALAIETVLVPPAPGVFSALGLLTSDVEHAYTASIMRRVDEIGEDALAEALAMLGQRAVAALAEQGHPAERVRVVYAAELRYAGQAYELTVPVAPGEGPDAATGRFHDEHQKTYGHASPGDPVDLVAIRALARVGEPDGRLDYAALSAAAAGAGDAAVTATRRRAYYGGAYGFIDTDVVSRSALTADWRGGPLIIEEYDATCVVPPAARARLDALGNIEIAVPIEVAA